MTKEAGGARPNPSAQRDEPKSRKGRSKGGILATLVVVICLAVLLYLFPLMRRLCGIETVGFNLIFLYPVFLIMIVALKRILFARLRKSYVRGLVILLMALAALTAPILYLLLACFIEFRSWPTDTRKALAPTIECIDGEKMRLGHHPDSILQCLNKQPPTSRIYKITYWRSREQYHLDALWVMQPGAHVFRYSSQTDGWTRGYDTLWGSREWCPDVKWIGVTSYISSRREGLDGTNAWIEEVGNTRKPCQ